MEIIYKIGDFPDPGDRDVFNGIQEINKNNCSEALKHFEKGSNYDNEYALLFSAVIYYNGVGLDKREPAKAMDLCKKVASEWNNRIAQYLMGLMYIDGDEDIPADIETGIHLISLSADRGWPYAIATMGDIFRAGIHCKADQKKAITYFEKLAKKNDSETEIIKNGTLYLFSNKNLVVDFTHVNPNIMEAVQQNWFMTGFFSPVRNLRNVTDASSLDFKEYQRILIWYLLSENESSGVLAGQYRLSEIYRGGEGNVPENLNKVIYWTKMAAKNNYSYACSNLGNFYFRGLSGVKQDFKKAIYWNLKGHILRSSEGSFNLGLMYYLGKGVEKDWKKALDFYKTKATHGINLTSKLAYYIMGQIHQIGWDGVPQDYKAAYVCYEKAFELGIVMGALKIAGLYCSGLGVKKDQAKTIEWLRKAASNGCRNSCGKLLIFAIDHIGFKDTAPLIIEKLDSDLSDC